MRPPVPGRSRRWLGPQPAAFYPRFSLNRIERRVLRRVTHKHPGKSAAHLLCDYVHSLATYPAKLPAVPIFAGARNGSRLTGTHPGKRIAGTPTERLTQLWSVDLYE